MPAFRFGQPVGGVCQTAFVVQNIREAMEKFTRILHAGPWFLAEGMQIKNAVYRGHPMDTGITIACANTGHMQIELIRPADDAPSVFTETIIRGGYGFHHHAIAVRDFDAQLEKYADFDYEVALYFETGVNRVAFMDTKGKLPFFVEVIETTDLVEESFAAIYQSSVEWDGKEPIRDLASLRSVTATQKAGVPGARNKPIL